MHIMSELQKLNYESADLVPIYNNGQDNHMSAMADISKILQDHDKSEHHLKSEHDLNPEHCLKPRHGSVVHEQSLRHSSLTRDTITNAIAAQTRFSFFEEEARVILKQKEAEFNLTRIKMERKVAEQMAVAHAIKQYDFDKLSIRSCPAKLKSAVHMTCSF